MPETGVVAALYREIQSKANAPGENNISADDPSEYGHFMFHPDCCSKPTGERPMVRLHPSAIDDPDFLPLPESQKQVYSKEGNCSTCSPSPKSVLTATAKQQQQSRDCLASYSATKLNKKRATEIVNKLKITGKILCALRGKEVAIGIADYVIRISFATEGHCFWIPTAQYREIIAGPLHKRGEKGLAYQIPNHLLVGGPLRSSPHLITISAAFIRPSWTLIFVDHQCFMTFHVMHLRRQCVSADFESTSQLWLRFWSNNHGPVYSTQPVETGQVLDCFRQEVLALPPAQTLRIPTIWTTMKERQDVFNGFGAQESCDALFLALIHPLMPVTLLCGSDLMWTRFRTTVIDQHIFRVQRVLSPEKIGAERLPYISCQSPFRMNTHGHKLYTAGIPCYRREFVKLSTEQLTLAHNIGLFNKDAVLGDDGVARVPSIPFPPAHVEIKDVPLAPRKGCHFVKVPNYIHRIEKYQNSSTSFLHVYSPFTCRLPSTWPGHNNIWSGIVDFTKSVNDSTLGPYSFKVFVDAAWTQEHIQQAKSASSARHLIGRRPTLRSGHANVKRPKKENIPSGKSRTTQRSQLVHIGILDSTSAVTDEEQLLKTDDENSGGVTGPVRRLRPRKAKEKSLPYL
ncbi:hypothetical protein GG344DRAFT_82661 [Lentinula edodes]|nr:hypothetical protein GG344DRAFT_82661 [Lentinula edodes]